MTRFNLKEKPLIIIPVEVEGPLGISVVNLAIDTGATHLAIHPAYLTYAGYVPESGTRQTVYTANGRIMATLLEVSKISLLGHTTTRFKVLAQPFDPRLGIDGLIGLSLFKRLRKQLLIDFATNEVGLV